MMCLRRRSRWSFSITSSLASRSHRKAGPPYQESHYTELLGSRRIVVSSVICDSLRQNCNGAAEDTKALYNAPATSAFRSRCKRFQEASKMAPYSTIENIALNHSKVLVGFRLNGGIIDQTWIAPAGWGPKLTKLNQQSTWWHTIVYSVE